MSTERIYDHIRYQNLCEDTFIKVRELAKLKGGEYSGDEDRLLNFRRNGAKLGVPMELVWAIYVNKHYDAVMQYIQDLMTGKERIRLESLSGRVDDIIVYMLLFKAMLEEKEDASKGTN